MQKHIHTLNYENWTKINTPEIAYFFGYLWADGSLSTNAFSLEIVEDDFLDIWPILQKIGFTTYHTRLRNNSNKKQCAITCGQQKFVRLLRGLDFDKKSLHAPKKILEILPEKLKHYFFLGYIDGDGSISITGKQKISTRLAINSSIDYDWSFILKLCKKLKIHTFCLERKTRKHRSHKYSIFTLCSKDAILKFGNYIYQNFDKDSIGLKRKNQKFNDIKKIYKKMQVFHLQRHENALNRFKNSSQNITPNTNLIVNSELLR